jgi:hypothetical protein
VTTDISANPQVTTHPALDKRGAPSRIRTCAHGSGGGGSHLSNLCILPAWTRSLISPAAETIPRIFRIMDTSAVTARALHGMARVRSGQAPAWPLVSDRSVRRDSRSSMTSRVHPPGTPPVLVVLRAPSCLRLEERTRTLSGPSPDLSRARNLGPLLSVEPRCCLAGPAD